MSKPATDTLTLRALLILVGYSALLFTPSMLRDRVLSVHEAVLPQSARTMAMDGDWLVPKRGDVPWLESPPGPQWITVAIGKAAGLHDRAWVARLAAALMGTSVALMAAWMAARWFGGTTGLLTGLILASCYQVARYASLAEDEIFLAALVTAAMALFVRLEFPRESEEARPAASATGFLGGRPAGVFLFFVALGLTNLAKGLLFGTVLVLIPVLSFLVIGRHWRALRRYLWLWGWLAFLLIAAAWPLLVYQRQPDVLELWRFDLLGRVTGDYEELAEPFYYYLVRLPEALAPWIALAPVGFWITRRAARESPRSPERFLWCWALLVPAVLSIPGGKHHHYLLHGLVPWAVLAALGLRHVNGLLRWPAWGGRVRATVLFLLLGGGFAIGQWFHRGTHHFDGQFLREVRAKVPDNSTLLVDMDVGGLRGFHCLFYLPDDAVPLHNLSYLRSEAITADTAHVVTLYRKWPELDAVGTTEELFQSERTGRRTEKEDRLTLFRLDFRDDLVRVPATEAVSPMQAMYREAGPFLEVGE